MRAGRLDTSSVETMLSVRNTGLAVVMAIRARKTKTKVVSEWGLEMFSEGGENCLRDSRTNSAMLHSPISREQCILQFPARSHAFSCRVCVKHSLVPPHSFVPCDKNPHSANALHFLCTCSSNVHNLQTSCFISEQCLLYCDFNEYSKWMRRCLRPVSGLLPPAGERGCCLRCTNDF